jgi:ketosteroid isomerase-like protein
MDACWQGRRFEDLRSYLADDVVLVSAVPMPRVEGIEAAIEHYRNFMSYAQLTHCRQYSHVSTVRGDTIVVEFGAIVEWIYHDQAHHNEGLEVAVLARRAGAWRVVWRTQTVAIQVLATGRGASPGLPHRR